MAGIPSDVMETIQMFLCLVKNEVRIEKVILFGSYAKGTFTPDSDIDLAIVSPDFKEDACIENMTRLLCIANRVKADIQSLPFSMNEYVEQRGIMEEIMRTGVELKVA
jgi:predicted nucleotidyltransferase